MTPTSSEAEADTVSVPETVALVVGEVIPVVGGVVSGGGVVEDGDERVVAFALVD
jgi:hypothetical protein